MHTCAERLLSPHHRLWEFRRQICRSRGESARVVLEFIPVSSFLSAIIWSLRRAVSTLIGSSIRVNVVAKIIDRVIGSVTIRVWCAPLILRWTVSSPGNSIYRCGIWAGYKAEISVTNANFRVSGRLFYATPLQNRCIPIATSLLVRLSISKFGLTSENSMIRV